MSNNNNIVNKQVSLEDTKNPTETHRIKVEFTDLSWNPVTGCTKITEGCRNCYAARIAKKLHDNGNVRYTNGFNVTCHEDKLDVPLHWRKPREIFVNSMSDIFHDDVPAEFIKKIFCIMNQTLHHRYYVLTKRPKRMIAMISELEWTPNIWVGVSVEDEATLWRMDEMKKVPAIRNFVSVEPLLEDLGVLNLEGVDWIICGGESGPGARFIKKDWVRNVRDQCNAAGIPFYFKQWGGESRWETGRELDGRIWAECPDVPDVGESESN